MTMVAQRLVIKDWVPEQVANGPHGHWSTHSRRLRRARLMAFVHAKFAEWQPVEGKARLEVTLVFPVRRRRDGDNLHSRVKGLVDGLKEWLVDDSTEWLDLVVRAEVEPGVRETRVLLEPVA